MVQHIRQGTLASLALSVCIVGCSLSRPFQRKAVDATPVAFYGVPTIDQVIQVVNGNTDRVQQLQSSGGTLTVEGLPALQAMLALERPARFRLQAGLRLTGGNELDLGSNEDHFWFWAKRNQPPAVYYASHREFQAGSQNTLLPLSPQWLIEALGLVRLEPTHQHSGPFAHSTGRIQVRSEVPQLGGHLTRILILDDQRGSILEQYVYDQTGSLLASAIGSRHQYDPANGVSLPREVSVKLPLAQLAFTVRVDAYSINQLAAGQQLWTLPVIPGSPATDLMRMGTGILGTGILGAVPASRGTPPRMLRGQDSRFMRRRWLKSIWPRQP